MHGCVWALSRVRVCVSKGKYDVYSLYCRHTPGQIVFRLCAFANHTNTQTFKLFFSFFFSKLRSLIAVLFYQSLNATVRMFNHRGSFFFCCSHSFHERKFAMHVRMWALLRVMCGTFPTVSLVTHVLENDSLLELSYKTGGLVVVPRTSVRLTLSCLSPNCLIIVQNSVTHHLTKGRHFYRPADQLCPCFRAPPATSIAQVPIKRMAQNDRDQWSKPVLWPHHLFLVVVVWILGWACSLGSNGSPTSVEVGIYPPTPVTLVLVHVVISRSI